MLPSSPSTAAVPRPISPSSVPAASTTVTAQPVRLSSPALPVMTSVAAISSPGRGESISATGATSSATASRSEEHTSELQSLMRISYAVFCLKKKKNDYTSNYTNIHNIHHNITMNIKLQH